MMNLDEILRGIGSQMSRAATPPWNQPAQAPQAPDPMPSNSMGQFGSYLQSSFPSDPGPGPQWGSSPGTGPMWGSTPAQGPIWQSTPDSGPQWATQSALGHVAAATAKPTGPAHAGTAASNDAEVEAYIRQAAAQRSIDPNVATKVWGGEGRSNYAGDSNSSFGPYQLHYGNVATGGNAVGGLGDAFTKATGLDARDPATWQAQVDFALDHVKSGGWGPWHGAAAQGVGNWDGVGTYTAPQTLAPAETGASKADPHGGRPTQFDPQLTPAEQLAACGPTAAAAFSAAMGGSPVSVRQSLDIAKQNGYWNGQMQGPGSEVALLGKLGVHAQQESVNWDRAIQETGAGRPVLVDTPGHYYYLDSYDPHSGAFHVGTSGTDLKGGSEWMTPAQINSMAQSHGPARSLITAGA